MSGLDRPTALEFSFLLSIPTMIAATGWDLLKEIHPSKSAGAAGVAAAHVVMNSERWIVLLIGTVVSFIVALGVVEWFLHWVRKHGFTVFAIYRILLGGALLIWGAKFIGALTTAIRILPANCGPSKVNPMVPPAAILPGSVLSGRR